MDYLLLFTSVSPPYVSLNHVSKQTTVDFIIGFHLREKKSLLQ